MLQVLLGRASTPDGGGGLPGPPMPVPETREPAHPAGGGDATKGPTVPRVRVLHGAQRTHLQNLPDHGFPTIVGSCPLENFHVTRFTGLPLAPSRSPFYRPDVSSRYIAVEYRRQNGEPDHQPGSPRKSKVSKKRTSIGRSLGHRTPPRSTDPGQRARSTGPRRANAAGARTRRRSTKKQPARRTVRRLDDQGD